MSGLKDHEIAELTNELTKKIPTMNGLCPALPLPQMLREVIAQIVVGYLESKQLRIDKLITRLDCNCQRRGSRFYIDPNCSKHNI